MKITFVRKPKVVQSIDSCEPGQLIRRPGGGASLIYMVIQPLSGSKQGISLPEGFVQNGMMGPWELIDEAELVI